MAQRTRFYSVAEHFSDTIGETVMSEHDEKRHASMIQTRHDYVNTTEVQGESCINEENRHTIDVDEESNDSNADERIERSPETKRQRKNDLENLIWSVEATATIKTLSNIAERETIKDLLNCFDIDEAEHKNYTKTKENIEKCIQTWNMKEQKIIEAIEYINEEAKNKAISEMNYEDLITLLIHEITNKMPKWCTECQDWYKFEEGFKPQLKCMFCSVGMHNCNVTDESLIRRGLNWVCSGCSNNENYQANIEKVKFQMIKGLIYRNDKKNEANKASENNVPESDVTNKTDERMNITNKRKREDEIKKVEVVADVHIKKTDNKTSITSDKGIIRIDNRDGNSNINESTNNNNDNNRNGNNNNNGNRKRTCVFWVKDKCRFGNDCRYLHPERCSAMLAYGECHKQNCNLFHPKMCRDLKNIGKCERGNSCYYTHQQIVQVNRNGYQSENVKDKYVGYEGGRRGSNKYHMGFEKQSMRHYDYHEQDHHGRRSNNETFLWPSSVNWETMKTPIMERAAQILAEKMMW